MPGNQRLKWPQLTKKGSLQTLCDDWFCRCWGMSGKIGQEGPPGSPPPTENVSIALYRPFASTSSVLISEIFGVTHSNFSWEGTKSLLLLEEVISFSRSRRILRLTSNYRTPGRTLAQDPTGQCNCSRTPQSIIQFPIKNCPQAYLKYSPMAQRPFQQLGHKMLHWRGNKY